ncbi:hypothetical protein MKW92_001199 [Papaver armeniacum]|nr:hypothetical protein MKW92_001199 [Papaver armeniacum]
MKSDDATPDSCNVWMRALAASSDIYLGLRGGSKELEKRSDKSLTAYKFLITLYGRTEILLEV